MLQNEIGVRSFLFLYYYYYYYLDIVRHGQLVLRTEGEEAGKIGCLFPEPEPVA